MAILLTEAAKPSNEVPCRPPLYGRRASDRRSSTAPAVVFRPPLAEEAVAADDA